MNPRNKHIGHPAMMAVVAIMMVAIYAWIVALMPPAFDDIGFGYRYRLANGGSESLSLRALWSFGLEQWSIENGRLANMVSPLLSVVLPRWLSAILLGCVITAMIWLMAWLSAPSRQLSPLRLVGVWAVAIVAFPWWDRMFLIDFSLNYQLSCLLMLTSMWAFVRMAQGWLPHPWVLTICVVAAVLAGWVHEGFGLPLLCGFGLFALSRRLRMGWRLLLMVVAVAVGLAVALSSPGLWNRIGLTGDNGLKFLFSSALRVVAYGMPAAALAGVVSIVQLCSSAGRKRLREFMQMPLALVLTGVVVTSLAVAVWSRSIRGAWSGEAAALVALFNYQALYHPLKLGRRWRVIVALSVLVAIIIFYLNVARAQIAINRYDQAIYTELQSSPVVQAYRSDGEMLQPSWLTLGVPFAERFSLISMYELRYADAPLHRLFALLPPELKEFDPSRCQPIDGNWDAFYYDGWLLTRRALRFDGLCMPYTLVAKVTCPDGRTLVTDFHARMFQASNGEYLFLLRPRKARLEGRFTRFDVLQ